MENYLNKVVHTPYSNIAEKIKIITRTCDHRLIANFSGSLVNCHGDAYLNVSILIFIMELIWCKTLGHFGTYMCIFRLSKRVG